MSLFTAFVLALIEGITEFLPISSTGHMILVSSLLGIESDTFVKTFEIAIQLGAVLAIALLYVRTLLAGTLLYKKLFVAFVPTALIGFGLYHIIKTYLFSPWVVAVALIVGGVILIVLDAWLGKNEGKKTALAEIPYKNAFLIGLFQSLAVIPGVSRAGATIVGGVTQGLSRKQATEFSFLLALPTMAAATGYDLLKTSIHLGVYEWILLIFGAFVAFCTAWGTVRLFVSFVARKGFAVFGYYRIVLGCVFLLYLFFEKGI